jgi:predicted amidohydrolase
MSALRIAAAQSASIPLDIDANLRRHLDFIGAAAAEGVELLVFPELSLSGYELAGLADCALRADDGRLDALAERTRAAGMTVVLGAPIANRGALPSIGAITLHADGRRSVYRKHFLHDGEERHVGAGSAISQVHAVNGVSAALAICADASDTRHPHAASVAGASLYAAAMLITPGGYAADSAQLAGYARLYRLDVLLVNHAAPTGGFDSAGRSALWRAGGELAGAAAGPGELLLVADHQGARVVDMAA